MSFEYIQYVKGCLVFPIFVSLSALALILSATLHFSTTYFQHKLLSRNAIGFLLSIIICGFFLCMNIGRILHGGIHLIYEREQDAIEIQGEITNIHELGRFSFPELESDYENGEANGVQLTIDGIRCTAITQGYLTIGDKVTVLYLPQSGYVLSIYLAE